MLAEDWGASDDSYQFVTDGNEQYIASNLGDKSLLQAELSVIAYVDSAGRMVYGKAVDERTHKAVAFPQSLKEHLTGDCLLLERNSLQGVKGLLPLPEGILMVASRPIITSEHEGPSRGTLIMGRFLDTELIRKWSEVTHLALSVVRLDRTWPPGEDQEVRKTLLAGASLAVRALDRKTVAGYATVKDLYGRSALVMKIEMPRDIFKEGRASSVRLFWFLWVGGLLTLAVTLWLTDKMVLARLMGLASVVEQVGATGNLALRIPLHGRDELSRLAGSINAMLSALERTRRLQGREQCYRALTERLCTAQQHCLDIIDSLPDPTMILGQDQKVIAWNRAMEELTGVSKDKVINQDGLVYSVPFYGHPRPMLCNQFFREQGEPLAPEYLEAEQHGQTLYLERFMPTVYGGRGAFMGIAASPLFDADGRLIGAIESLRDLTEREQSEKQMKYLRDHDPFTGLYNRNRLRDELRTLTENGVSTLGVILCEVDGLELISQNFDDETGDEALTATADLLRESFGPDAVLGRAGDAEFLVLLPEADEATVESGCLRIHQALAEHNQLPGRSTLRLSLGYSVGPLSAGPARLARTAISQVYREKLTRPANVLGAIWQSYTEALSAQHDLKEKYPGEFADLLSAAVERVLSEGRSEPKEEAGGDWA